MAAGGDPVVLEGGVGPATAVAEILGRQAGRSGAGVVGDLDGPAQKESPPGHTDAPVQFSVLVGVGNPFSLGPRLKDENLQRLLGLTILEADLQKSARVSCARLTEL